MPAIKEPCKQEACNIQSCLTKNAFNPERCLDVILKLQKRCDHCDNKSTHCLSETASSTDNQESKSTQSASVNLSSKQIT